MPGVYQYQVTASAPLAMPGKSPYYPPPVQQAPYSRPAISPPSAGSSVSSSAVPSLTSGSRTGSTTGDHDSPNGGARGVDLIEMMTDRLSSAIDPLPMDRSLARQAQGSGALHAKQLELLELQAMAQRRLKRARPNLADGMKAANEVRRDLEWTQKKVSTLNEKAAWKYPAAYKTASATYPSAVDC